MDEAGILWGICALAIFRGLFNGLDQPLEGGSGHHFSLYDLNPLGVKLFERLYVNPLALWRLVVITHTGQHWRGVVANLDHLSGLV